jgi:hypothetical protein
MRKDLSLWGESLFLVSAAALLLLGMFVLTSEVPVRRGNAEVPVSIAEILLSKNSTAD